MEEFKGAKAFLMIPVGIARDQDLLDNSKSILLMGEILSMLNVTGEFFMGNAELAKRLKTTPRTVKRYLILLENKGLIKRTNVYADKEKKVVVGRKITAGDTLVTYMSLGWGQARHEGGDTDVTRVVTPTSPKYNKLIDQSNRSSNTSSSKPSSSNDEIKDPFAEQQDDDDEKIVDGLIGMFLGEAKISGLAPYEREHIKQQLLKMGRANAIDFMYTMINKISTSSIGNPIAYLEKSLMNAKSGEANE
ncbi:putative replication protein [Lactobacillus phage CR191]|nr:putative replication protein [Lactobacillus phage CR191]WFD53200.1 putative replication protein [Lactobacillus phage T280]